MFVPERDMVCDLHHKNAVVKYMKGVIAMKLKKIDFVVILF